MGMNFEVSGVPKIDDARCTRCGRCTEICASRSLQIEGDRVVVAKRMFMGCIACGHCAAVCPEDAITVEGRRLDEGDMVALPPRSQWATPDQLDGLFLARRSIRKYRDEEVDRADVDRILAMTSTAPMGIPPTDVGILVFHGREKVRRFVDETMDVFRQSRKMFSPWVLPWLRLMAGKATYELLRNFVRPLLDGLLAGREQGRDDLYYDAPLVLLFYSNTSIDETDHVIAATYAMLAAQSLGLGTCMIGTTGILTRAPQFKEKHGIPADAKIGLALTVGHPDVAFERSIRRKMAAVTFA